MKIREIGEEILNKLSEKRKDVLSDFMILAIIINIVENISDDKLKTEIEGYLNKITYEFKERDFDEERSNGDRIRWEGFECYNDWTS